MANKFRIFFLLFFALVSSSYAADLENARQLLKESIAAQQKALDALNKLFDVSTAGVKVTRQIQFTDGDSRSWQSLCTLDNAIDSTYPHDHLQQKANSATRKSAIEQVKADVEEKCNERGLTCSDIVVTVSPRTYFNGPICDFTAYPRVIR